MVKELSRVNKSEVCLDDEAFEYMMPWIGREYAGWLRTPNAAVLVGTP